MFGFKKKHKLIRVTFIEEGQSQPFAVSDVPPEQLPNTFAVRTAMEIEGEQWGVLESTPTSKDEYVRTGKLTLVLTKVTVKTMDPHDVLFTLPTISDELGAVVDVRVTESTLVVKEDDWRQCEFVAKRFLPEVDAELADIQAICDSTTESGGFKNIHLRKRISCPLSDPALTLKALKVPLQITKVFEGVAFNVRDAQIADGFAFQLDDESVLWGHAPNGIVQSLSRLGDDRLSAQTLDMMKTHNLIHVDWCRRLKSL